MHAGCHNRDDTPAAPVTPNPDLVQVGKQIFRFDTFGDERQWTDAATGVVDRLGRPSRYLESSRISKEEVARRFLAEHPIHRSGPICLLSAVEPCHS